MSRVDLGNLKYHTLHVNTVVIVREVLTVQKAKFIVKFQYDRKPTELSIPNLTVETFYML